MKLSKILTLFFIFICLIIFVISSYLIVSNFLAYKSNEKSVEELIENVIEVNTSQNVNVDSDKNINWCKLKSINADIIGWIEIEGTKVNYPILKDCNSNLYYLRHSYNKEYNINGSIFTTNEKPFTDQETIIYGHNMQNGSMFSILEKYLDSDFFYSHQKFKIYTKNENYQATVFSVYTIGVDVESKNIEHLNYKDRIKYYQKESKNKVANIQLSNKIVKLSTCSYTNARVSPTDQRCYVIANITPI